VSALSEAYDDFTAAGAEVLEISVDDIEKQKAWSESLGGIKVPVLSDDDPKGQISKQYGILSKKNTSRRSTFIVDRDGVIQDARIYPPGSLPSVAKLLPVVQGLAS
jgi:alkyl hydroperoxide reductase subunit AhpC